MMQNQWEIRFFFFLIDFFTVLDTFFFHLF